MGKLRKGLVAFLNVYMKVVRGINYFARWLALLSGFFVIAIMVVGDFEVISRYVFRSPTIWSFEIATYFLIAAVFLAVAYTQTQHGHVWIDVVVKLMSPRVRAIVGIIINFLSLVYIGFFIYASWGLAWLSFTRGFASPTTLRLPLFPMQVCIPIGLFLLAIVLAAQISEKIRGLGRIDSSRILNSQERDVTDI